MSASSIPDEVATMTRVLETSEHSTEITEDEVSLDSIGSLEGEEFFEALEEAACLIGLDCDEVEGSILISGFDGDRALLDKVEDMAMSRGAEVVPSPSSDGTVLRIRTGG